MDPGSFSLSVPLSHEAAFHLVALTSLYFRLNSSEFDPKLLCGSAWLCKAEGTGPLPQPGGTGGATGQKTPVSTYLPIPGNLD